MTITRKVERANSRFITWLIPGDAILAFLNATGLHDPLERLVHRLNDFLVKHQRH